MNGDGYKCRSTEQVLVLFKDREKNALQRIQYNIIV
jgi:hypothetical protein